MKICISSYSLSRWRRENHKNLEAALDQVAAMGVNAIELAGNDDMAVDQPVQRPAKVRKLARQRGLEIISYCVGAELLVPRAAQRQAVEHLKKHVEAAAELGCQSMRHDVTRGYGAWADDLSGPRTLGRAWAYVAPAIRQVASHGARLGLKTTVENHGYYLQASRRVEALLKRVNHRNFALTLDMGNFLCAPEDPVQAVRRLARYAVMVHVKDFLVRPKEDLPIPGWFPAARRYALCGAILGKGRVDLPRQLRLLNRAGYDGYLSLEFEGPGDPLKGIRQGLAYLRKQLAALPV